MALERKYEWQCPMSDHGGICTFCPECGPNVHVDEDGCCRCCGALAMGDGVRSLDAYTRILEKEIHKLEAEIVRLSEAEQNDTDMLMALDDENASLRKEVARLRRAIGWSDLHPWQPIKFAWTWDGKGRMAIARCPSCGRTTAWGPEPCVPDPSFRAGENV